jgi:hypothetical protein
MKGKYRIEDAQQDIRYEKRDNCNEKIISVIKK